MKDSRHDAAREAVRQSSRIVIKIGSAVLASIAQGVDTERIRSIVAATAKFQAAGRKVALVSSGAVAAGTSQLGWDARPDDVARMQAAAAVGQGTLIRLYSEACSAFNLPVGQMLLTRDGLDERERYLNARNTLNALFDAGAVPVINENDTVMVEELKFGDNDQLSAMVAGMAEANLLIILSDIDGLHERSPAEGASPLVSFVERITPEIEAMAGASTSGISRGGMASKLSAARMATGHGANVVLASGAETNILERIMAGESVGTCFLASENPLAARKRWLTGLALSGTVTVDAGAERALTAKGKSLLPVGIMAIQGAFQPGDAIGILNADGREVGRGIANFSATELLTLRGEHSDHIATILGHPSPSTAIHRDNLVLTA